MDKKKLRQVIVDKEVKEDFEALKDHNRKEAANHIEKIETLIKTALKKKLFPKKVLAEVRAKLKKESEEYGYPFEEADLILELYYSDEIIKTITDAPLRNKICKLLKRADIDWDAPTRKYNLEEGLDGEVIPLDPVMVLNFKGGIFPPDVFHSYRDCSEEVQAELREGLLPGGFLSLRIDLKKNKTELKNIVAELIDKAQPLIDTVIMTKGKEIEKYVHNRLEALLMEGQSSQEALFAISSELGKIGCKLNVPSIRKRYVKKFLEKYSMSHLSEFKKIKQEGDK